MRSEVETESSLPAKSPDMLGRATKIAWPDGYQATYTYDSFGRQIKQTDGFTTTLTTYNGMGEAFRTAVDMNNNDTIDLAGADRISETESSYAVFNGQNVRETVAKTYPTNGSAVSLVLSTSFSSLDGTKAWTISFGRTNHTEVARNRATASRTETVTRPDGTQTVSTYTNNLLKSVQTLSSVSSVLSVVNYSYDPFNRLLSNAEPAANGNTRTTSYLYNPAGVATSVTVSAGSLSQTTAYELDNMGRVVKTTLPDGGILSRQFSAKGELLSETGARAYPVTYSYTDSGRLSTMSTYRNGISGSADVTTWNYDSQRGWLTAKTYADGLSVSYEYLMNSSLKKRAWARGVYTEYSYDAGGSLTNLNYSDATPDVSYSLDRLGRIVRRRA